MDLREMLERVLSEELGLSGLKIGKVVESPCSKPGDNYMSVVSGADVQGVLADGTPFSISLFIKQPVVNPEYREMFGVADAFHNEVTTYLQIIPLYDVIVPCPRCYYADSDVIVLEDLRVEGYTMSERCKGFDLNSSKHAMKAIAKFHAASYHANFTKKAKFVEFTHLLKPLFINNSSSSMMLEGLIARIYSEIGEDPEFKWFLEYIKPIEGKVQQQIKKLRKASNIEVLCHGDFWINNILVRPGVDEPVRLVDLQAGALTSPAVDVWSFLYSSLETAIMDDHIDGLLQLYCNTFVDELTALKLTQAQIPCRKELMEDLVSRELYGFIIANLYSPALLATSESLKNLETVTKEDIMNEEFMKSMQSLGMKERLIKLISICEKRGVFTKPL